ncbi:hypothetical protein [Lederbergia citri]|uniref:Uncharacterized protein n=1 Tax=Lederbergia citri TaxID=2833580 RepID=A0A942TDL2_9BACI|nr:hypothetical protein [Lederbergia citri]MBS4194317.1 hypothetical protein [Lederbergia citri]
MNYEDVVKSFEDAGYTNIMVNVDYDIITGRLTDEGEIESVTIDGEKKINSYDEFRLDAEVKITYHDLRKNKNK